MGTRCGDIFSFMDRLAPPSLAENWDNVGLILGSGEKAAGKILLCLDVTSQTVEEALKCGAQLIISHHPFIFKKIGRIHEENFKGSLIYKLIKADISVFCAHTNLDVVECGVNEKLAERLELNDITGLKKDSASASDNAAENNRPTDANSMKTPGLGAVGYLKAGLKLEEFVAFVKEKLEVKNIRLIGHTAGDIRKVAVFCGSFDDDLEVVLRQKADILVTGDLKYHTAVDALAMGMCIIDAGHFNTEKVILPALQERIEAEFPGVEVICSKLEADPFNTY